MRILEIGRSPYVSVYAPAITDFYGASRLVPREKWLTLRQILRLRKELKKGTYDLVVYHIEVKILAPWHRYPGKLRIGLEVLAWIFLTFYKISWHVFHYFLKGVDTPLVVIDTQDAPRINKTESFWLDRCTLWFMRELPPNHMNLFLNMDRRCGDIVNIQRNKKLARNFPKIRPFSLGFAPGDEIGAAEPLEKIYDIFYAGANHTTTVRLEGVEELRALQSDGVRVFTPEGRLPRADFLRACAQSWIVWSPEGQGWDCHRHYEALMLGSVPLINLPTIKRLWPFIEGEHCFYYRPEKGGLREAVEKALQDRERLRRIAAQGRAHILEHHTRSGLVRHVLASVGMLERAGAGVVGG